jgi:hypothetical protein
MLGWTEMLIMGHIPNYNGHGPCWRIMVFGGKLGGDSQTRTLIVRAGINMGFSEDVAWEMHKH